MTKPSADVLESERDKLFVTDAELIRRLGVPEKIARAAIHMLDRTRGSGFPQKQKLWGNRRYWPAVKAWFCPTSSQSSLVGFAAIEARMSGRYSSKRGWERASAERV